MGKVIKKSTESQLLEAREENLNSVREMYTMKALGKVAGMDVFSWVNPEVEVLGTMLDSMSSKVIWLASKEQVEELFDQDENALNNIESIVVYNATKLNTVNDWISSRTSIACVDGLEDALELIGAMKQPERVFLFTLPKNNWTPIKDKVELRLMTWN